MASSFAIAAILVASIALLGGTSAEGTPFYNLTEILVRGGQYNTLIHHLEATQVGTQIQNQVNNSYDGITLFAPTDNAFSNLRPGLINSLTQQQQSAFILYHVLPKFYTLADFQTASNPMRTQASGNGGDFYLNITSSAQQTNLSTGVVTVPVRTPLNVTRPLAIYSIDEVLLPYDLFGNKTTAAAPPPQVPQSDPKTPAADDGKNGTSSQSEHPTGAGTGVVVSGGGVWRWVVGMGIVGVWTVM